MYIDKLHMGHLFDIMERLWSKKVSSHGNMKTLLLLLNLIVVKKKVPKSMCLYMTYIIQYS